MQRTSGKPQTARAKAFRSAWIPAPPPESEPAIDRQTGMRAGVARLIAAQVEDGACLQVGIGGMPNAVCALLLEAAYAISAYTPKC